MAKTVERSPFERAAAEGLAGTATPTDTAAPFGTRVHGGARLYPQRVGKEVMAARVRELANALLDGAAVPGSDMVLFIRQLEADAASAFYVGGGRDPLSYCQARRMVQKAERSIAEAVEGDRQKLLAQHIAKRRRLFERAVQRGDVRAALAVLDSEANLLGLFPEKAGLPGGAGGVNLQVLVQAVIAAEAKTLEAINVEAVPVEQTATAAAALIGGSNGDATETAGGGGGCRDEADAAGSEAMP